MHGGGKEMTRKVVEFLETNMGMVEDNLGQVGNNSTYFILYSSRVK